MCLYQHHYRRLSLLRAVSLRLVSRCMHIWRARVKVVFSPVLIFVYWFLLRKCKRKRRIHFLDAHFGFFFRIRFLSLSLTSSLHWWLQSVRQYFHLTIENTFHIISIILEKENPWAREREKSEEMIWFVVGSSHFLLDTTRVVIRELVTDDGV